MSDPEAEKFVEIGLAEIKELD